MSILRHSSRMRGGALLLLAGLVLAALALLAPGSAQAASPKPGTGPAAPDGVAAILADGFEGADLDHSQFVSAVPTCAPGGCGWTVESGIYHTGNHAAMVPDVAGVADQQLLPASGFAIPGDATAVTLTFWQRYNLEYSGATMFDGGVLEVSLDGGTHWGDAGSHITQGGYTGTIAAATNPLHGRAAWGGTTNGLFALVSVDLTGYAGHALLFRFRLGTDSANTHGSPVGWWIDDVLLRVTAPDHCGPAGWAAAPAYPIAAFGIASVGQGAALYNFGGATTSGITAAAYRLDTATNTWASIAPLPEPRAQAGAVSDGTDIYIVGGGDAAGQVTNTLWRYDPATNTYATLPASSDAADGAAVVYLRGKVYRIAGSGTSGPLASVAAFTIATQTWTPLAPYPFPIEDLMATTDGTYLYAAGGFAAGSAGSNKTYRYDPHAGFWDDTAIADLPGGRLAAGSAFYNGRWILAGGANNVTLDSRLAWDPATDAWRSLETLPAPVAAPGTGVAGDSLYLVGGIGPNGLVPAVRRWRETACPPITPTPTPTPTACPIVFSDVHPADYFYGPVLRLACDGVISGYADGTFRPYNNTTRAQMVKIVVLGFGLPIVTPTPAGAYTFADVPSGAPFFDVVETGAAGGFISGYACGGPNEPCDSAHRPYFRPNANVTRGQLSKIVVGAAAWLPFSPASPSFADVLPGTAFYTFVETAACHGVISGYTCGGPGEPCDPQQRPYFRQGNQATRGQIAKIVDLGIAAPTGCAPP